MLHNKIKGLFGWLYITAATSIAHTDVSTQECQFERRYNGSGRWHRKIDCGLGGQLLREERRV